MTKQDSQVYDSPRQAGDSTDEIEITSEMEKAGADVILASFDEVGWARAEQVAREMFLAMRRLETHSL